MPLPDNERLHFTYLAGGYKWDPQKNLFQHKKELLDYFKADPNVTSAGIRAVLSDGISLPDRFLRTSADRGNATMLNNQMQTVFADIIASRAYTVNRYASNPDNAAAFTKLARGAIFFRTEEEGKPDPFNQQLLNAALDFDNNPDTLRSLMLGELTRLGKKLGLDTPEGIKRLYNISDTELVDKFSELSQYTRMVSEIKNGNLTHFFTQEQLDQLQSLSPVYEMSMYLEERANLIANPLYTEIDPNRLVDHNVSSTKFHDLIANNIPGIDEDNVSRHHAGQFFTGMENFFRTSADILPLRLAALNPNLEGLFDEEPAKSDFTMALQVGGHAVIVGKDNNQYVVSNKTSLDKVPTAKDYTKELLDRALKADKFLLTGSKQFDNMIKAVQDLHEAQDLGWSNRELQGRVNRVLEAAQTYLGYKQANPDSYSGYSSVHGKNQREQTRLEVAGDILAYAKAQVTTLTNILDKKAAAAQQFESQKQEIKKPEVKPLEDIKFNLTTTSQKENFLTATLPEHLKTVFDREVPLMEKKVGEKVTHISVMDQDQFTALCALTLGSPKAHYNYGVKVLDDQGKQVYNGNRPVYDVKTALNTNPEQTYINTVKAVFNKRAINTLEPELGKMIDGTTGAVYHGIKEGKFNGIGEMVADGLKLNNKLMQNQRRFTPEFYAYAKLTANALSLMEKNPELNTAVMKHLSPQDLQTAKACKAIYDVIIDGLEAHKSLINRFGMNTQVGFNRGDGDKELGILGDMARVYQMNILQKQFIGGNLNLATSDYGKNPTHAQTVNKILAADESLRTFVNELEGMQQQERNNAINNPKAMMDRGDQSMQNILRAVQQQQSQNQLGLNSQLIQQPQQISQSAPSAAPKHIS